MTYAVTYSSWHKRAGCLEIRTKNVEADGKRAAWKAVKEALVKQYDRPLFCGCMRFYKERIEKIPA